MRGRAIIPTLMAALLLAVGCARPREQSIRDQGHDVGDQVVNVVAKEFAFVPKEIRIKKGEVRFVVENKGAVEHEFMIVGIQEHGEHGQETFKPGATFTIEAELKPGRYSVVCNLPGHKEAGMSAILVVE